MSDPIWNALKILFQGAFWSAAFEKETRNRALRVSLVVGTILIFINQGDRIAPAVLALIGEGDGDAASLPPIWKLLLTYAVPYSVSTYSAASFKAALVRKEVERVFEDA